MCENRQTFSASAIRYLIVLNSLDKEGGIRCVDIAKELSLTKPSVYRMVEMFCGRAIVKHSKYGTVYLTERGRELAAHYAEYYDVVFRFFRDLSLQSRDSESAACAILAVVSDESACNMCGRMRELTNICEMDTVY